MHTALFHRCDLIRQRTDTSQVAVLQDDPHGPGEDGTSTFAGLGIQGEAVYVDVFCKKIFLLND